MPKFIILEQLRLYPIEILDLSHRVNSRLKDEGIETLNDLSRYNEDQLLSIYHFGLKSLIQIKKRLQLLNECASTTGKPSSDIIECMRLKINKDEQLLEDMVKSVVSNTEPATLTFYLAQVPMRPAYVLIERFGMKHEKKRTLQEIANIMSLTRERVRQLQVRGMRWMNRFLSGETSLRKWEIILSECANNCSSNENAFLLKIEDSGICGGVNPAGFVIFTTNLILGTPIPTLIKASKIQKLHRFWKRLKHRKY